MGPGSPALTGDSGLSCPVTRPGANDRIFSIDTNLNLPEPVITILAITILAIPNLIGPNLIGPNLIDWIVADRVLMAQLIGDSRKGPRNIGQQIGANQPATRSLCHLDQIVVSVTIEPVEHDRGSISGSARRLRVAAAIHRFTTR